MLLELVYLIKRGYAYFSRHIFQIYMREIMFYIMQTLCWPPSYYTSHFAGLRPQH